MEKYCSTFWPPSLKNDENIDSTLEDFIEAHKKWALNDSETYTTTTRKSTLMIPILILFVSNRCYSRALNLTVERLCGSFALLAEQTSHSINLKPLKNIFFEKPNKSTSTESKDKPQKLQKLKTNKYDMLFANSSALNPGLRIYSRRKNLHKTIMSLLGSQKVATNSSTGETNLASEEYINNVCGRILNDRSRNMMMTRMLNLFYVVSQESVVLIERQDLSMLTGIWIAISKVLFQPKCSSSLDFTKEEPTTDFFSFVTKVEDKEDSYCFGFGSVDEQFVIEFLLTVTSWFFQIDDHLGGKSSSHQETDKESVLIFSDHVSKALREIYQIALSWIQRSLCPLSYIFVTDLQHVCFGEDPTGLSKVEDWMSKDLGSSWSSKESTDGMFSSDSNKSDFYGNTTEDEEESEEQRDEDSSELL